MVEMFALGFLFGSASTIILATVLDAIYGYDDDNYWG